MRNRARITKIRLKTLGMIATLTCCFCIAIATVKTPVIAKSPDWVVRSDQFSNLLLKASQAQDCKTQSTVVDRLLEIDRTFQTCRRETLQKAVQTVEEGLAQEKNASLHLDLEILLKQGQQRLQWYKLNQEHRLPYVHLSKAILDTLESTLSEAKPFSRKREVLAKLNELTGHESGKAALAFSLEQTMRIHLQKAEIVFPTAEQLGKDLKNNASVIYSIETFLREHNIPGYEAVYAPLKTQLFNYETFIRREVLPRAEQNFRLPRELYLLKLEE